MTSLHYPAFPHCNGNMFCGVDLETTGTTPGWHEIIQIAIVPCDTEFKPLEHVAPFYRELAPSHPEREDHQATKVHGLSIDYLAQTASSQEETIDALVEWFNGLDLAFERRIIPIAHNYQFEATFLKAWLGLELFDRIFLANARDSMAAANFINDHALIQGRPTPFERVNLQWLCNHFGIRNLNPHDAYCDAVAGMELYGKLCKMDVLL